jgi:prepilin-type N-terminal cleavage/methylation domain-containing protein
MTPERHVWGSWRGDPARRSNDSGVTLIEMLVTIVLLGVAVTAILGAVRTTTLASAIDEDHAIGFTWLQAASDEIYRAPRRPCDTNTQAAIETAYSASANAAPRPDAWLTNPTAVIAVTKVQFLGKPNPDAEYEWGDSYCLEGGAYASAPQYTQRVTIQVTTPRGVVKTLQMVKGK